MHNEFHSAITRTLVPLFLQDDARKNIAGSTRRKNERRRGLIDDNRASEMPEGEEGPG